MEESQDQPPNDITYLAMAFEGGLCLIAIAVGWVIGTDPLDTLRWTVEQLPRQGWAAVWGLAATLPLLAGMVLIDRFPVGPLRGLKQIVDNTIVPLFSQADVAQLALVSLLAGLGEELLFRGLLQTAIADQIDGALGIWIGLIVASLIFGACHWVSRTYAVLAALVGIYLGALFLWTESLLAPIIAHALYDFVALFYLVFWKRK